MTTAALILRDLAVGQSTLDALAQRLTLPRRVLESYLQDLELAGHVLSSEIGHAKTGTPLPIWRITAAGRQTLT